MRIVVSATEKDINGPVDVRFGRCPYFLVIEAEGKSIKSHRAVENRSANQMGAAGMTSAQEVAEMKPDAIITVNIGPRAFVVFKQLGIDVYQAGGTVKEAVEALLQGKLKKVEGSTGPGHMGMPGFGQGRRMQ